MFKHDNKRQLTPLRILIPLGYLGGFVPLMATQILNPPPLEPQRSLDASLVLFGQLGLLAVIGFYALVVAPNVTYCRDISANGDTILIPYSENLRPFGGVLVAYATQVLSAAVVMKRPAADPFLEVRMAEGGVLRFSIARLSRYRGADGATYLEWLLGQPFGIRTHGQPPKQE